MPYVTRDANNRIVAVSDKPTQQGQEMLSPDNPEILEYLEDAKPSVMLDELSRSDLEMARIVEDLIDVLVSKNILNFTDLPLPAQRKLVGRQKLRRNLSVLTNLVGDRDDIL